MLDCFVFSWVHPRAALFHVLCTEVIQHMLDFQGLDPLAHIANNDEEADEEENEEEVFADVPSPSKKGN